MDHAASISEMDKPSKVVMCTCSRCIRIHGLEPFYLEAVAISLSMWIPLRSPTSAAKVATSFSVKTTVEVATCPIRTAATAEAHRASQLCPRDGLCTAHSCLPSHPDRPATLRSAIHGVRCRTLPTRDIRRPSERLRVPLERRSRAITGARISVSGEQRSPYATGFSTSGAPVGNRSVVARINGLARSFTLSRRGVF